MYTLRPARSDEYSALAELFYASVHAINHPLYQASEKAAWAPWPIDKARWQTRFHTTQPWVICQHDTPLGFAELRPNGHIDCFYIAPTHQRKGLGIQLYLHLEALARQQALPALFVDASAVAQPFFQQQGFETLKTQQVLRAACTLTNYQMRKTLHTSLSTPATKAECPLINFRI